MTDLQEVVSTSRVVRRLRASICVEIDDINVDAFIYTKSHEREAFRSEAVALGSIGAFIPFDTLEVDPVELGE